MHLTPHRYKIVILKENAQEIIIFKCVGHQICTKLLLSKQMLRKSLLENAFNTKYVQNYYFKGTPQHKKTNKVVWTCEDD